MKTRMLSAWILYCGLLVQAVCYGGEFINLNFESVRQPLEFLDPPQDARVAPEIAFPGWSASQNGVPVNTVAYNTFSLGSGSVDLFATFDPRSGSGKRFVIGGNYSAGLQTGFGLSSLSQSGTIPGDSRSMFFDTIGNQFSVSIGGSLVPTVPILEGTTSSGQQYRTFGVDVSSLAGIQTEIKFSSATVDPFFVLDNVRFSSQVIVPEPSTYVLFGVGLVVLVSRRRRSIRN